MIDDKMPRNMFILAAGRGTRMQPLTQNTPKPLIEVNGQPIVDHILDQCVADNIVNIGMNLHFFGNKLEAHLENRDDINIHYSKEAQLLDTGGGLRKATRMMGDSPFFVSSGDSYWVDGPDESALTRLGNFWDPEKMDIVLLLQPISNMHITKGVGDYDINEQGEIKRSLDQKGTHMFTSLRIMKPEVMRGTPDGPFSFLDVLDRVEREGRLYGLEHDGDWHHLSTAEDVDNVTRYLQKHH